MRPLLPSPHACSQVWHRQAEGPRLQAAALRCTLTWYESHLQELRLPSHHNRHVPAFKSVKHIVSNVCKMMPLLRAVRRAHLEVLDILQNTH